MCHKQFEDKQFWGAVRVSEGLGDHAKLFGGKISLIYSIHGTFSLLTLDSGDSSEIVGSLSGTHWRFRSQRAPGDVRGRWARELQLHTLVQ